MREAGVLMPVASVSADYGVGDFGKQTYEFIDILKKSNISIWQILPLNPLGYGESPYQPYSSMAGDEIYIDLVRLYEEGLLADVPPAFRKTSTKIKYQEVRKYKEKYLKMAFKAFLPDKEYEEFIEQEWVYLYGVFLTLKKKNELKCWNEWKTEHKNWIQDRRFDETVYEKDIRYEMFVQYEFYRQWMALKSYANHSGIQIMGDVPFYVGIDSLDVWTNQEDFLLDKDGHPVFIAGVPPDYFSRTGQRWGNPIYNWERMEENNFHFWLERFGYTAKLFDIIRIDHFRAFDTYWKIPASCDTAIEGEWLEAPGYELFDLLLKTYPDIHIVAEDLGEMRPQVYELRDHYSLKGMKIIQFSFDPLEGNNGFPDRENMMVYTGTHDNETILGWFENQSGQVQNETELELYAYGYVSGSISHKFIRYTLDNLAEIAIIPVQDILEMGNEGRINTPGTLGSPNWEWKLSSLEELHAQTEFLAAAVTESGRFGEIRKVTEKIKDSARLLTKLLEQQFGKTIGACTREELLLGLLGMVKRLAADRTERDEKRKLYYISAEFLIGKLLSNNLINLGIYEDMRELLAASGQDLTEIEEAEPEPSLGNGGLGRLAACFLDSIATLGLAGDGIGLNYHLGLFKQHFKDFLQKEEKNPWMEKACWLTKKKNSYEVEFGSFKVKSILYNIDVIGYQNRNNKLHLFDSELVDEGLVEEGIEFDKKDIKKNLTLFLYPDDSDEAGRQLRIYQQYFMVSCGAQLILEESVRRGSDLHDLYEYAVIQINDTHPSLVIPELIRLLIKRGIALDEAISIVTKTCAYTNHTILAEALEKWPLDYLKKVVPQLVPIIEILDNRVRRKYGKEEVAIIDSRERVHMASMDIHYGFSVNGVAALHTDILKTTELNHFYKLYPEKFNNKTNGITFRRWLLHCNRELAFFIESLIGDGFHKDSMELNKLIHFRKEERVLSRLLNIKYQNKRKLKSWLEKDQGITIDENSIFDIQIKRLHEYKRQQMNALYVIYKYQEIKDGKLPEIPITVIFGAKAAPAYIIAKDIIHLILCLQELINNDPQVSPYLKVVMVEDYNVTKAEVLIPACDISEQISLASKEASGTGNMKFMLNGAVTLGTLDGANVEISDLVGGENIYLFGETSDQVIRHYQKADYISKRYYQKDDDIKKALDFIISERMLAIGQKENLQRLYKEILNKDWFMSLLDFKDYIRAREEAYTDYKDRLGWAEKMLVNISKAGYFSSDRTIREYNEQIWKLDGDIKRK
ncbi:4-alpha-glucanotransferase [Anaerocolumna xylanovorans]|uniref:Alpha-1,4 glucan phosphorylase n=1 Tax=Anaerocolumna xylanovorans DSM 12503 TaxID=1121345 RepID=A0A1M7YMS4_9FIRM|nr:4-alpha-glucanotransferase [Anaerocolumna xylanovorans]SHO53882.1 starch phosphorylase [Anaerocolumna xylanovorans DSM 12503]